MAFPRALKFQLPQFVSCALLVLLNRTCDAFVLPQSTAKTTALRLSPLPKGISPFEKSLSKGVDVQAQFRQSAKRAIDAAIKDGIRKIEIEFPPLIGGDKSKSNFDDFDNVQELDRNKEFAMLLAPLFLGEEAYQKGKTWLIFPDLKECELAKSDYPGQRYREATFTTIEAVANKNLNSERGYDAPWGANMMAGLSQMIGGDGGDAGLLGNQAALDELDSPANLWLVVQPGNGGPVEDWVNCAKIAASQPETPMVIINGALDKVKGGFYPAVFFPKLAKTVDPFYNKFESVFYIKPFTDKGAYGWLYRVYPEPWQVYLESVKPGKANNPEVEYVKVAVLDKRPSYAEVVSLLLNASQE